METICGLFTFTPIIVIIDGLCAGNIMVIYLLHVIWGHSQMMSEERGREGGHPNSDAVREFA